jgi:hypothetical protein
MRKKKTKSNSTISLADGKVFEASKKRGGDHIIIWDATEKNCEMVNAEILKLKSIKHTPKKIIMEVERCDTGQVCKCIIRTNLEKK